MKIKNNVKCFISMIAIILYPSMFMYFQNMSEGHFIEILPSIGKNLILAVVLLVAFSVLFRNIRKAFLTSEIALLLFMNFNTILGAIKKIIPGMRKAYFFVIVAVILTIVFSVIKRKINEPENICTILGIVFFVLIVFNLISSIPQILTNNNKTAVSQEENDIAEKRFTGDKPNVYFFLFASIYFLWAFSTLLCPLFSFFHKGCAIPLRLFSQGQRFFHAGMVQVLTLKQQALGV